MTPIEQLNAIAGLCFKTVGWPNTLMKLGYMVDRIELKFNVVDETGRSRTVNPDLVLVSDSKNSSLFFELKSGSPQLECEDQLKRSCMVTLEDVIQKASITSSDPEKHAFSFPLTCNDKDAQKYTSIIEKNNWKLPVISISDKKIYLFKNEIEETETNKVFIDGIDIENQYPPVSLIPITGDSSEDEISESVINAVILMLVKKVRSFSIEKLMDEVFPSSLWQIFDPEAKKALRAKVRTILDKMCNTEFKKYISRRGGINQNPAEWTLTNHPDNKKTTQFQSLKKTKVEYISRTISGDAYKDYNPSQDTLFKILEENQIKDGIND